jgi:multidrug efflux pump subunit AcrB
LEKELTRAKDEGSRGHQAVQRSEVLVNGLARGRLCFYLLTRGLLQRRRKALEEEPEEELEQELRQAKDSSGVAGALRASVRSRVADLMGFYHRFVHPSLRNNARWVVVIVLMCVVHRLKFFQAIRNRFLPQ